jgi:vacuolar protein sorting-associated protein IST1
MHKYGREFSAVVMENRDGIVTERVSLKLYSTQLLSANSSRWCLVFLLHTEMTILTTILSAELKVARKLTIATPSPELVDAYLTEIAKAYSVNWSPTPPRITDSDDGPHGRVGVSHITPLPHPSN